MECDKLTSSGILQIRWIQSMHNEAQKERIWRTASDGILDSPMFGNLSQRRTRPLTNSLWIDGNPTLPWHVDTTYHSRVASRKCVSSSCKRSCKRKELVRLFFGTLYLMHFHMQATQIFSHSGLNALSSVRHWKFPKWKMQSNSLKKRCS